MTEQAGRADHCGADSGTPEGRTAEFAAAIADEILSRSSHVAVAESCTAGALASALAEGGNGSQWLRAGLVAYQDEVKRQLLGVEASSTVTGRAASEMVTGAARLFDTDVAAATTGVIGDEPVDGVEPGTVMIATYVRDDVRVTENHFEDHDPEALSQDAVLVALRQLLDHLGGGAPRAQQGSDRARET